MSVDLGSVDKSFGGGIRALRDVSLRIASGELIVILGPSGCGKTTLLRGIAGLERFSRGTVRIDGDDATGVPPHRRGVAMVSQDDALFPHMTAEANIRLGIRRLKREERARRVGVASEMLGIDGLLDRKPGTLSGGQRRRVAMARAIAMRPRVLLLDEPLRGLDAPLRSELRREIRRVHEKIGCTTVWVSHDPVEAVDVGDRVAVMEGGGVVQIGSATELAETPATELVARFMPASAISAAART